jgi:broad specificity phosphatase PhoE
MGRSCDLPIIEGSAGSFIERVAWILDESARNNAVVCSSPARRCLQTAALLQDVIGKSTDLHVLAELHEMNYGSFEGKSAEEIKRSNPEVFHDWMNCPGSVRFPEGETFDEVQKRASNCLKDLIVQHRSHIDASLFLITHVDVIKMLLCWLLNISINDKRLFRVDPGSFSCLETTGNIYNKKRLTLRYLNLMG